MGFRVEGKVRHALHRHRLPGAAGKLGGPVQWAAGGAVDHRRDVGGVRGAVAQQQNGLAILPAIKLPARLVRVLGVLLFVDKGSMDSIRSSSILEEPSTGTASNPSVPSRRTE